ncbi:MAG: PAS domain-containing sensor histidine kinase [Methanoculleaceae archaeon]
MKKELDSDTSVKIVVITSLVVVSILLSYIEISHSYFLSVFIYYIPIILVALWFPRRLAPFTVVLAIVFVALTVTFSFWGYLIDPVLSALYAGSFLWISGAMTAIDRRSVSRYLQNGTGSRPFHGASLTYDPESGKIISCSSRFAQMLGYFASDLEGLPEEGLWVDSGERDLFHRLAEGTPDGFTGEVALRSRGGREKKVIITSKKNPKTGFVTHTVESCSLPPRRARVKENRGFMPATEMDGPYNLVIIQDLKGKILHFQWDRAVEFGFDPASMCGKMMCEFLPPGASDYHENCIKQVKDSGEVSRYDLIFSAGENEALLSMTLSPLCDTQGSINGIVISGRDRGIELKRSELLTNEEIQERWKDYITTFAHELRTPLQPILGYISILRDDAKMFGISDEALRYIENCLDNLEKEREIIDRMLEFSLASSWSTPLKKEPQLLKELVSEVIDEGGYDEMAEITVFIPEDTVISTDRDRMRYVLNALISNAIKYNRDPKSVKIAYRGTEDGHHIMVSDNGIGIDADQLKCIFDPFYLADGNQTNRQCGRLGLSLSVAREYISHHGGYITVTSQIGEGSTFTIHLPKEDKHEEENSGN